MSELSCNQVVQRLPMLVVGDLTSTEEREIDQHAKTCRSCARDIAESRRLSALLDLAWSDRRIDEHVTKTLPALQQRLHAALPRRVAYDRIASPVGPLFVVVSDRGLCGIRFGGTEEDLVAWGRSANLEPAPSVAATRSVVGQLREYFAGERREFDLPVDLSAATPFAREVLDATQQVPYGRLASYRTIAQAIEKPGATRAVGNALGSNPVPIVVPCHRIVRSDGSLGGYTGGLDIKRRLLALEGALLVG